MENPISITMLNDFVFCPISIYFHNLYQGVEKNLYQGKSQIAGTKAHEAIDNNTLSNSESFQDIENKFSKRFNQQDSVYIFIMDSRTEIKRYGYAKNEEKDIIVI